MKTNKINMEKIIIEQDDIFGEMKENFSIFDDFILSKKGTIFLIIDDETIVSNIIPFNPKKHIFNSTHKNSFIINYIKGYDTYLYQEILKYSPDLLK